ncbi:hypothetical protein HK405_002901 [Cladochytrium tenue]|nr:hypothetical protein HK405_002901 [Cladochytrium tenue]
MDADAGPPPPPPPPLFTILAGDDATPFVVPATAFRAFPRTFLSDRIAAAVDPAGFPFADPLVVRLPDCPAAVFRRVVMPFYDVAGVPVWSVPGMDTAAKVPFEIPDGETIDAVVAVLSEGAIGSSEPVSQPHTLAPPGATSAVKEDEDDDTDLDPSVVDRCLKFLLIPSPYDLPALDRMMAVVRRQLDAQYSVLEWHMHRASILRQVAAGGTFELPKVLENELTAHFRLNGLKLELRQKLLNDKSLDEDWISEFPRFAPQACQAADVEFRDPQAVSLMKSLEKLGLLDRIYFRRFDMQTETEIHLSSCYHGNNRDDIYLDTIEPASGKAETGRKKAVITVGDVDALISPPKDARVFHSKDLERVPPEVLQAKLLISSAFIKSEERITPWSYEHPSDLDWPFVISRCSEGTDDCPAAVQTTYKLGIVFCNRPASAFQLFAQARQTELRGRPPSFSVLERQLYREWEALRYARKADYARLSAKARRKARAGLRRLGITASWDDEKIEDEED